LISVTAKASRLQSQMVYSSRWRQHNPSKCLEALTQWQSVTS